MSILLTKRLRLRPWQVGDEALLATFLGDEKVMYAYEGAFSEEEISQWLKWNLASYEENGFGLWGIEDKFTGKILGECGLTLQTVSGEKWLEIGYHLIYEAWHQGFALEAATAVKEYAFDVLKVDKVCSTIRDTNLASMNVAIGNQMRVRQRFIKHYRKVKMPHYLFVVTKEEYQNKPSAD